jgi:hypothetical protein
MSGEPQRAVLKAALHELVKAMDFCASPSAAYRSDQRLRPSTAIQAFSFFPTKSNIRLYS